MLAEEAVDGDVCAAFAMRRVFDVLHASARGQAGRDVLPRFAVVARDVNGAVIGAHPDDAALQPRFDHRVDRRVDLFAGDVAGDGVAGQHLYSGSCGQIAADGFPRDAFVGRAMKHVRRLVNDAIVVRRKVDHRLAREAELDVVGVMAVAVLRINPVVLF